MSLPKKWIGDVSTNVVANLIAGLILIFATALIGVIVAYFTKEPLLTLLILIAILLLINTLVTVFLVYLLRKPLLDLQESVQDLSQQSREFQDSIQDSPLFPSKGFQVKSSRLDRFFPIIDKYFDEDAQKIVIVFTNETDSPFYIKKVTYSDKDLKDSAIDYLRKESDSGRVLLDIDKSNGGQIGPGQTFELEIMLKQNWRRQDINSMIGELGYLRIFVDHKDKENEEMFYSI